MAAPQEAVVGGAVKIVSFTITGTAATIKSWLADATARDLDTGAVPTFSTDGIAQVLLTGYTGTLAYGGSNSQPIVCPANSDFTIPSSRFHDTTYVKANASTFTVYAVIVFKS